MISSSICLVAVSDSDCALENLDLTVLMKRAVRIEERMIKGVNLSDEQRRYHTLCDRIEYYGQMIAGEKPIKEMVLSSVYLELLVTAFDKEKDSSTKGRLAACFCPKDLISTHLEMLVDLEHRLGFAKYPDWQKAIELYKYAKEKKLNVIELHKVDLENVVGVGLLDQNHLADDFLSLKVRDEIVADDEKNAFIALRNHIKSVTSSLRNGIPAAVNFSDLRHDVITEMLNEFVYARGSKLSVPVMYADGSVANPFPLNCLQIRKKEALFPLESAPVLNVGMMSERHPELDPKIKIYWYLNHEISIGKTAAEIDTAAYHKAKEQLIKMRDEGVYNIAFYQTGFQPAVVGFYRALTEELLFRATSMAKLSVTPYYFLGGEYRVGKMWA